MEGVATVMDGGVAAVMNEGGLGDVSH